MKNKELFKSILDTFIEEYNKKYDKKIKNVEIIQRYGYSPFIGKEHKTKDKFHFVEVFIEQNLIISISYKITDDNLFDIGGKSEEYLYEKLIQHLSVLSLHYMFHEESKFNIINKN